MAERDYKKEYQRAKERDLGNVKRFSIRIDNELYEDFRSKAELNSDSASDLIRDGLKSIHMVLIITKSQPI